MREEIAAAVVFMTRLIKSSGSLKKDEVTLFSETLAAVLVEKFRNHWYEEDPIKGQAYRCIRINDLQPIDPTLAKVAENCDLEYSDLGLPMELTLWVDPKDVSCRFDEGRGTTCTVASYKDGAMDNKAHSINIDSYIEKQRLDREADRNKLNKRTSKRLTNKHLETSSMDIYNYPMEPLPNVENTYCNTYSFFPSMYSPMKEQSLMQAQYNHQPMRGDLAASGSDGERSDDSGEDSETRTSSSAPSPVPSAPRSKSSTPVKDVVGDKENAKPKLSRAPGAKRAIARSPQNGVPQGKLNGTSSPHGKKSSIPWSIHSSPSSGKHFNAPPHPFPHHGPPPPPHHGHHPPMGPPRGYPPPPPFPARHGFFPPGHSVGGRRDRFNWMRNSGHDLVRA